MKGLAVANAFLDILLPPSCLGCSSRLVGVDPHQVLCGACHLRLVPPPAPRCSRCDHPLGTRREGPHPCRECLEWPGVLVEARAGTELNPAAHRLVHALKYQGWRRAAGPMARVMADRLSDLPQDLLLVPVPTTPQRLRKRGYNQARLLAEALAQRLDRPCVDALERRGSGPSQVALHPSQRRTNVNHVFEASRAPQVAGRPVLLVDDVLTTGATACAAARVLEEARASRVLLIVFARALTDRDQQDP